MAGFQKLCRMVCSRVFKTGSVIGHAQSMMPSLTGLDRNSCERSSCKCTSHKSRQCVSTGIGMQGTLGRI